MNENESLWLEREPSLGEIMSAFDERRDLHELEEVVFCGFGEPMERPEDVITLTSHFKKSGMKVRLNTNGLVRLMHPDFDISLLEELDVISISLNADNADEYLRVTRPRFGKAAYEEMLSFAAAVKNYTQVILSIVGVIEPCRIENCRKIAERLGVAFRVR